MHRSAGPSRSAPPPPQSAGSGNPNPHRYTPTTNWDDSPFDELQRKVPPPRPPPPRVQPSSAVPFKKSMPQSVNILSNLFGSRGASNSKTTTTGAGVKLPPPPAALKKHHQYQSTTARVPTTVKSPSMSSLSNVRNSAVNNNYTNTTASELIDWSSPPSSPTLTHKTHNSDCISVDSFGSETNSNSSPQNGSYSQAESGFEDDFAMQRPSSTGGSFQDFRRVSNQITMMDPFSAPPVRSDNIGGVAAAKIRNVPPPPPIAQKPKIVEQSAFYTQNSISFQAMAKPFDDPLNNGKSLIAPPTTVSMPTIIKPVISAKPMGIPQKGFKSQLVQQRNSSREEEEEKTPSPPMPNCAPPPPPPEYFRLGGVPEVDDDEEEEESHGIALYDYESEHDGDLNFRANDKIYLVRQETEEWMFGRCKRGCEGLLPVNYIEIKVPLRTTKQVTTGRNVAVSSASAKINVPVPVVESRKEERRCRALYDFNAEAAEDLSITEGDVITIVEQINEEWLLGRKKNGTQGQFPAAFVEYL